MASSLFFSTLDGVSYQKIYNDILKLDRNVFSYDERLKNVEKITNKNPYLKTFFNTYYDPHLTKDDALSEDHNICHLVEMLTNYLLMSDEAKRLEDKDKTFYIDADKLDKGKKETAQDIMEGSQKENYQVMKFNKSNITKSKKVQISQKDLQEKSKTGDILRDLQEAKDEATYKIKNGIGNRFKLSKLKHEINQDQLQVKISLKGIFALNTTPSFSMSFNDNYITLSEAGVVKNLLTLHKNGDISENLLDLERILKEIPFSDKDKDILYMFSQGFPTIEIADKHHVSHQSISKRIVFLAKKIARYNHLKQSRCLIDKFYYKQLN